MDDKSDEIIKRYRSVINCNKCRCDNITNIVNDDFHRPHPGFIGKNYWDKRILFVDRNPALAQVVDGSYTSREVNYMKCLKNIGNGSEDNIYHPAILNDFIAYFTIQPHYKKVFELTKLSLDDISIVNVVRCRMRNNKIPSKKIVRNCIELHFNKWIKMLSPGIMVAFGKIPYGHIKEIATDSNINIEFINRSRCLNKIQRQEEIEKIVIFIKNYINDR